MKHLLVIVALVMFMVSCKKETSESALQNSLLDKIKVQLKDSLSAADFQQLDLGNSVSTAIPNSGIKYLRVPFLNKSIKSDFILLKIETDNSFSAGKIFNISKDAQPTITKTVAIFNGKIEIHSLQRKLLTASTITNGYVDAFSVNQTNVVARDEIVEIPLMPPVVIICYLPSGGSGSSYSDYYDLGSLFSGGSSGSAVSTGGNLGGTGSVGNAQGTEGTGTAGNGSYYSNSNPNDPGISIPHPSGGGYNAPVIDYPVSINFEMVASLPAININQYLKCFASVPDAGATCTIKILADLPIDNNPGDFFNWQTGAVGHTFLQLTKSNGGQSVQQNIGFYPTIDWHSILTFTPVDGKFVDNAHHKFNASFSMNVTPDNFKTALVHMQNLSGIVKYDIDDYNCTDFALDIFNSVRGANQLKIPRFQIPYSVKPEGSSTPQGLYIKLKAMKDENGPEAANILIPGVRGFAGNSTGPWH